MQSKHIRSTDHLPYNYYSHVHRFMRNFLSDFGTAIGKCDFRIPSQVTALEQRFLSFQQLLDGHAAHEDKAYHPKLKGKDENVLAEAEKQHQNLDNQVKLLTEIFYSAKSSQINNEKLKHGYEFLIRYNDFLADYFKHLNYEEMVIMPTLNRFYSREEIRQVTFNTYSHMSPQQFIDMFTRMDPYLNTYEKTVFLIDLQECEPAKFDEVLPLIAQKLSPDEKVLVFNDLGIDPDWDPKRVNVSNYSPLFKY